MMTPRPFSATSPPVPPLPEMPADPADIEAARRRWMRAANAVEGEQDHASGPAVAGIGNPGDRWTGPGAEAYVSAAAPIAAGLAVAQAALVAGSRALAEYADRVVELRRKHADLAARHRSLTGIRAMLGVGSPESRAAEIAGYARDVARFRREVARAETAISASLLAVAGPDAAEAAARTGALDPDNSATRSALDEIHHGAVPDDLVRMSATERARWWARLEDTERAAVIRELPEHIAHGDGIPPSVRDEAGRQLLDRDIARADAADEACRQGAHMPGASPIPTIDASKARSVRRAIDKAEKSGHRVMLYDYAPTAFGGDGRAVIGIGDLDNARDVSFSVPGMSTTLNSAEGAVGDAVALYDAATQSDSSDSPPSLATVAWLGYDAPSGALGGLPQVPSTAQAAAGGEQLARDLRGLVTAREHLGSPAPAIHLIGHSYGSTTVGYAGADGRLAGLVDTVTLIGSPGAGPVDRAADFGIGASNVFVGSHPVDQVAQLGGISNIPGTALGPLGTDPATSGFGAERFHVTGGSPIPLLGPHTGYYAPGSDSLANLARIVTGHGDEITHEDRRGLLDVLDRREMLDLPVIGPIIPRLLS